MTNQDAAKIIEGLMAVDRLRLLNPERAALTQAAELLRTEPVPLVKRPATGRTIPDLTKREHVCEWQSEIRNRRAPPRRRVSGSWRCVIWNTS